MAWGLTLDVAGALERMAGGGVPPRLRPYGALALLAVAVDLGEALRRAQALPAGNPADGTEATVRLPPPTAVEVHLPSCAAPRALEALARSPAMRWPASDTGGISFAEVVEGRTDAAVAAGHWLPAFFAARHPRILDPSRRDGAAAAERN